MTPGIALVTRETRMQGLIARWGTPGQARFRLTQAHEHEAARPTRGSSRSPKTSDDELAPLSAAGFAAYEEEDQTYQTVLQRLRAELEQEAPVSVVDRKYLPTYDFRGSVVVVVVGQDGLVANAAKYVGEVPIVAVNPDPRTIDGVLLPFTVENARRAVRRVIAEKAELRAVTLAEAVMNDGQRLLAFNDLFVGCATHASARYTLTVGGRTEPQSSSGMIVATGAGSTGWLSSMFNMHRGFATWQGEWSTCSLTMSWDDPRLAWVVREPFRSKQSGADLVAGLLNPSDELIVESLMSTRGVIFSDGVEADCLEFNSGAIARISRADHRARLVVG